MAAEDILLSWAAAGAERRVECSASVLDRMASAARDGFHQFRHGGMEVGGLLIGYSSPSFVRIAGSRPFEIEYGRGAFFLLTENDHLRFQELVRETNREFAARGLQVVGYYESRTRRAVTLSETDHETFDSHFSDSTGVCIVLKPEREDAPITAVYVRGEHGNILQAGASEPAYIEDSPEDIQTETIELQEPEPAPEPEDEEVFEHQAPVVAPRIVAPAIAPPAPQARTIGRRWIYALPAAAAILGALLWIIFGRSAPTPIPPKTIVEAPAPVTPAPVAPEVETARQEPVVKSTGQTKKSKRARSRRARARSVNR